MDDIEAEIIDIFDQLEYCLSLRFREKYRHKFGTSLVTIFQDEILKSLDSARPILIKNLKLTLTGKHRYNPAMIEEFFEVISIELYYPIIQ